MVQRFYKYFLLAFVLLFIQLFTSSLVAIVQAQQSDNELSRVDKTALLGKIWGFLKYYHPNVATGKVDWDEQLILMLQKVNESSNDEEFGLILESWVPSLGEVKLCKKCADQGKDVQYFDENWDLTWINSIGLINEQLSDDLKWIAENRNLKKPYYVAFKSPNQTLTITNERKYDEFQWEDRGMRMLSLIRFWNTIAYFYPHKYLIDQNWDEVLLEMITKFDGVASALDYHLAILELVVKLDDSHGYFTTVLINAYFGTKSLPVAWRFVEGRLIVTGIYDETLASLYDVQIGDEVRKIAGQPVETILESRLKYINGANLDAKYKYAFGKLFIGSSDTVLVELERAGEVHQRSLVKFDPKEFAFSSSCQDWKMLENNVGYINLQNINQKNLEGGLKTMEEAKAIILDLRNYPKAYFGSIFNNFFGVKDQFINKQINADLTYPGRFLISDQNVKPRPSKYKGQVFVLVNEYTQSRAEYMALHLQNAYHVTLIGSQTAGAGGVMVPLDFADGSSAFFTSSGIFYPDFTPIQRFGIKVDVEVRPTVNGIREGKDEVLEVAVQLANQW